MTDKAIEQGRTQRSNQIIEGLLSGSVKQEELLNSTTRINQVVNESSKMLASKLGEETVYGIRVLLAASITPTDPGVAAKDLLRSTSVNFEGLDQDKAKRIISMASQGLAQSALGEETRLLRTMIGAAVIGKGDPEIINNLLGGSGVKPDSVSEQTSSNYVRGASSKLSETKLGVEGTKALRVLIGTTLASTKF